MKKKTFILLFLTFIIFFNTISFANMGNDVKSTLNGATNSIVDGTQNLSEDVRNGISNAENTIENGVKGIGNAITDSANNMRTNANYTDNDNVTGYNAVRTTTTDFTGNNTMNSSMWAWIILAIAAAVIVGLVWYYAVQNNNTH